MPNYSGAAMLAMAVLCPYHTNADLVQLEQLRLRTVVAARLALERNARVIERLESGRRLLAHFCRRARLNPELRQMRLPLDGSLLGRPLELGRAPFHLALHGSLHRAHLLALRLALLRRRRALLLECHGLGLGLGLGLGSGFGFGFGLRFGFGFGFGFGLGLWLGL